MITPYKRMFGGYEIIHALHIGDREIIVGDNPNAPKGERFMCVTCLYIDAFINQDDRDVWLKGEIYFEGEFLLVKILVFGKTSTILNNDIT